VEQSVEWLLCGSHKGPLLAGSTSSRMAPESGRWKNERVANVGNLEPIPRGSPRPRTDRRGQTDNGSNEPTAAAHRFLKAAI